ARDEEAVVQALVGRQRLRPLGEVSVETEDPAAGGRGPQEHLEDEEVQVQGGDQADQHAGDDVHTRSMAASARSRPRGRRRATATPTRASAPPTYAIAGAVSSRKTQPIRMVRGGTRYV